jgi:ribosomal protein S10
VVTMEDLAGPHPVPNRILRVGARRQPFARRLLR